MPRQVKPSMYVSGLSAWRPDEVLTNADLAKLVDTSDEWIVEHVGIRERRKSPADLPVHQMGAAAARLALAGEDLSSIDLVICGLSVADYEIPATANLVASEAGLIQAACLDVRAACSSFVFGLHVLRGLLATGQHKKALLVIPEAYTHVTDYRDRNSCVLWGDAAVACLVSADPPVRGGFAVEDTRVGSRSTGWEAITVKKGGHFVQKGPVVQAFAIRKMATIVGDQLKASGLEVKDVDWFVGHQANGGILRTVCALAGFRPEQSLTNIERFGNTGAAGAPSVLADHQGHLKDRERVVVATVGAGLSWGTALLRVVGPR